MRSRIIAGALALALGTGSVASAHGTLPPDSLEKERGSFWMGKLDPSDKLTPQQAAEQIFQGITLTKAQEDTYHQFFLRHTDEISKLYAYEKAEWPTAPASVEPPNAVAYAWENTRDFFLIREYAAVLTSAQQALFQKNVDGALRRFGRGMLWEPGLTKDSLAVERGYGLWMQGMQWLDFHRALDVWKGITLTPAQTATYHTLIPSHYAALREHYLSYKDGLSPEDKKARTAKRQALEDQYAKDYRAVLTPAQQALFETSLFEQRSTVCKAEKDAREEAEKTNPGAYKAFPKISCDDIKK